MSKQDHPVEQAISSFQAYAQGSEHALRASAGVLTWMQLIGRYEQNSDSEAWKAHVSTYWARLAKCTQPMIAESIRVTPTQSLVAASQFGKWLAPRIGWDPASIFASGMIPQQVAKKYSKSGKHLSKPFTFEPWEAVDVSDLMKAAYEFAQQKAQAVTTHYRACPSEKLKRQHFALGVVVEQTAAAIMSTEPPASFPVWSEIGHPRLDEVLMDQIEWNIVTSSALHALSIPAVAQRLLSEVGMSSVDDFGNIYLIGEYPDDLRAIPVEFALARIGSVIQASLAPIDRDVADGFTCLGMVTKTLRNELGLDLADAPEFDRVWSQAFREGRQSS